MKILGISAYYHDSAAALIENGIIISAAQEERFTRVKHDASFPKNAIEFCLNSNNLLLADIDTVVFYDKPFLKLERILETYYRNAPKGWWQFINAMPAWLKEKLFLKSTIKKALKEIDFVDFKKTKLLFSEHHLSHAASAFYPSGYNEAAILTIDGVGEWATASICKGQENSITVLEEMHFPNSSGLLYSAFTYFLGFKVNSGEYKLMGLAPYGNPNDKQTLEFVRLIKSQLVSISDTGFIKLNQDFFSYTTSFRMIHTKKWEKLFSISIRKDNDELLQHHCNLAFAIQTVTEEIVLKMTKHAKHITNAKNLCLAGGVALNCVANGKLKEEKIFDNIFIQPASGDAGGAVGAALAVYYLHYQKERFVDKHALKNIFLGPGFSDNSILRVLERHQLNYTKVDDTTLVQSAAKHLNEDKIIGWFQGSMEFGPRALGNRSILANAGSTEMQQKLNLKIKKRESFRPFAPIMLESEIKNYFNETDTSPYMLFVHKIKEDKQNALPTNYYDLSLADRLRIKRSDIPAVTHLDFSARIQTVNAEQNKLIYELLKEFKGLNGKGILVNTSFNVRGEPIVCTPKDAIFCFMNTDMDVLAIGNYLLLKEKQPKAIFYTFEQTFNKD